MKWLAALLFTVICRPGTIYEVDGSITEIWGTSRSTYYYFDLEYPAGAYLYVSLEGKDSVWFMVEDGVEYLYDVQSNEEFEIQK